MCLSHVPEYPHAFTLGTVPSGGVAAFMKRAVIKANRALARGLAETGAAAAQAPPRGETAGDFLRALRETKAKIHVDLGPKIKVCRLAYERYMRTAACVCGREPP